MKVWEIHACWNPSLCSTTYVWSVFIVRKCLLYAVDHAHMIIVGLLVNPLSFMLFVINYSEAGSWGNISRVNWIWAQCSDLYRHENRHSGKDRPIRILILVIKRATRCTRAPAYAGSGKGSHHLVYCTQSNSCYMCINIFHLDNYNEIIPHSPCSKADNPLLFFWIKLNFFFMHLYYNWYNEWSTEY